MERIQKLIAAAGIASRRKAEEMIAQGRVTLNGKVVTEPGTKADVNDVITVDGKPLRREEKVYYVMNKPKGVICSVSDDKGRQTVVSIMPDVEARIFPVGRLDYDTTGVLILTNDGEFANKMMHPRYKLPKTYLVSCTGEFTEEQADQLRKGIVLEDGKTLPAKVHILSSSTRKKTQMRITIREGRNRQIRRMIEHFGSEVTRLERIRYGTVDCTKLRQGEYRKLRMYEVKRLLHYAETGEDQETSRP